MRTRNLLFALALPAAFAACSQDEFVTEEGSVSLAGRKSLGKITLVDELQTRMIAGSGINFEDGDALSAALIDEPKAGLAGAHDYVYDNYSITNYISTNYEFVKESGAWNSNAAMVEGNYIFLAPYVKHFLRQPMEATLPAEQNLKLKADGTIDGKSAIQDVIDKKNPVLIAHRFLAANGETEHGINFHSIYAYPVITVKNTDALRQEVIVKKVMLKKDKGFTLNAPFSNENVRNALMNEVFEAKGEDTKDQALMGAWASKAVKNFGVKANHDGENKLQGEELPEELELTVFGVGVNEKVEKTQWYNGLTGKTSDLLGTPKTTGDYIVINFPGEGYKLKYGESVSFNAVIPADDYQMGESEDGDLELYVMVNNNVEGKGTVTNVWKKNLQGRSQQLTLYPGKSYPNQDYNQTELRPNKGGYFTILTGSESVGNIAASEKVENDFEDVGVVTTTSELEAAIKNIQSSTKQVIVVNGKNVKFNKAVNDAVANTKCQEIEIQGLVYIDGENKDMTVSDRVVFKNVVVESGDITVNGGENRLEKVFVAPKATLNLGAKAGEIHNAGTLVLKKGVVVENVYNYGRLEVAVDATEMKIVNSYAYCGDMNNEILSLPVKLEPSVEILGDGGQYAVGGEIDYPITINDKPAADKEAGKLVLKENAIIVEKGDIINNGEISSNSTETLTVKQNRSMTVGETGKVESKVIILGKSVLPIDGNKYIGTFATVTNNGAMEDVEVNGLLVMGNNSARVNGNITVDTDDETAAGEIDNTAKGVLVNNPAAGIVVFAELNSFELGTDTNVNKKAKEELKSYTEGSKKVTVFRLTGAMKVADGATRVLNATEIGNASLEFMPGSSLYVGEVTFSSDLDITVKGKDIKWSGVTATTSTLNLTGTLAKGECGAELNIATGKMEAVEGYVTSENLGGTDITDIEE